MHQQIESIDNEIAYLKRKRDSLITLRPIIETLGLYNVDICGAYLDFNRLSHENVIKVIAAFGGKWKKESGCDETINYVKEEKCGELTIRCWAGEPPASCHIVEEEVEVPEELVPAHTEIRRKLICHE